MFELNPALINFIKEAYNTYEPQFKTYNKFHSINRPGFGFKADGVTPSALSKISNRVIDALRNSR